MRSDYPKDKFKLPETNLAKYGIFDADYNVGSEIVLGWLKYETTKKEKRKYVFSVSWKNGVPDATISVADPELG